MSRWAGHVQAFLRRRGIDVRRYEGRSALGANLHNLMAQLGVQHVIDVGANEGQFALEVRQAGFLGRIDSFEPIGSTFELLQSNMVSDSGWHGHRLALSDSEREVEMNLYPWSTLASLTSTTEVGAQVFGSFLDDEFSVVATENTRTRRLDDLALPDLGPTFLKIDTQGHDWSVYSGATSTLNRVVLLAMELSFVPYYETSVAAWESLRRLAEDGFKLAYLDQTVARGDDPLIIGEADGYFVRSRGFSPG